MKGDNLIEAIVSDEGFFEDADDIKEALENWDEVQKELKTRFEKILENMEEDEESDEEAAD